MSNNINNTTTINIDYTSILIDYTAHRDTARTLQEMDLGDNELNRNILNGFLVEWDNAPCDKEGATQEQDDNLDSIIDSTVEELLEAQTNVNF